jgi:hypothetical protein
VDNATRDATRDTIHMGTHSVLTVLFVTVTAGDIPGGFASHYRLKSQAIG